MTTNCDLCKNKIDPNGPGTVTDGEYSYRHVRCDIESKRRYDQVLCLSCGETPRKLDRDSCETCGAAYVDANREYTNF